MFHTKQPLNEHPSQVRDAQLKQLSTCTSLADSQQAALEAAHAQSLPLGAATIAEKRKLSTDDVASLTSAGGSAVGRDTNVSALLQQILN